MGRRIFEAATFSDRHGHFGWHHLGIDKKYPTGTSISDAYLPPRSIKIHCSTESPAVKPFPKPAIIDVFAGVGGMSLGAARAGFSIALAVEKDPHIVAAHKLNFRNSKHLEGDVSEHSGTSLLEIAGLSPGELIGLVGGPPCQGFSSIGHRNKTDPRNDLFRYFFKLVSESRPYFFLAENVPGILQKQYDQQRQNALKLADGYTLLPPFRMKATHCGAPTIRERVFFVGYDASRFPELAPEDFVPSSDLPRTNVGTALKGLPKRINPLWLQEPQGWRKIKRELSSYYWDRIYSTVPEGVGSLNALARFKTESIVSGCLGTRHNEEIAARYGKLDASKVDALTKSMRLDAEGFCPTLRAGTGSDRGSFQAVRPIHPTEPRVITPREAARLQGFPDWFQFAPSKWHSFRMIGNSVSPFVSELIMAVFAKKLAAQEAELLAA